MAVMVSSESYSDSLRAFTFGYSRFDVRNQAKKIFSMVPFPYVPFLVMAIIVLILLWFLLNRRKNEEEIDLDCYLTRRNEGILISEKDEPYLLTGKKEDIARKIGIAVDRQVIEHGAVPNHIFFLLDKKDLDIFSDEVLEAIGDKHAWLFIEDKTPERLKKQLEKVGKLILFDPLYMRTSGNSDLTLGIVARFLSLIPRGSDTNLDHIFESIPYMSTISFSYPVDVHHSIASVLKHLKHFSTYRGDTCLQITNCKGFMGDLSNPARFVKADTEPFFISFKEVT